MGLLKGVLKTSLVMKAVDIARREASKPANQAKVKQIIGKVTSRGVKQPPAA